METNIFSSFSRCVRRLDFNSFIDKKYNDFIKLITQVLEPALAAVPCSNGA